jgi:pyruvate kinase
MRVNCSYDDRQAWIAMADNLKRARRELGKECRLSMDLAGPKLRVGPMETGPEVIKVRPVRDVSGMVVQPARIALVPQAQASEVASEAERVLIPVSAGDLTSLRPGDKIEFTDTRGSSRRMVVTGRTGERVEAECDRTSYLASAMELRRKGALDDVLHVGRLPALDQPIVLKKGDTIVLSNKLRLGRPPELGEDGRVLRRQRSTARSPRFSVTLRRASRCGLTMARSAE